MLAERISNRDRLKKKKTTPPISLPFSCVLNGGERAIANIRMSFMAIGFHCGSAGQESTCNVEDLGSILGLGSSPGEGKGYPLQYSGLENSMDWNGPWGHKESDMTEQLSLSFFIINIPVILYLL